MSVIAKFPSPIELVITQFFDHVSISFTSQFIIGISRLLQKLLKYFNGTNISTSFVLPSTEVFLVLFTLYLNDSEFAKLTLGSSL